MSAQKYPGHCGVGRIGHPSMFFRTDDQSVLRLVVQRIPTRTLRDGMLPGVESEARHAAPQYTRETGRSRRVRYACVCGAG